MEGAVAGRDADYHGGLLGLSAGGKVRDLPVRGRGVWFCYTDVGWGEGRLRFLAEPRNDSGTGWVGGKGRHETCPNGEGCVVLLYGCRLGGEAP